MKPVIIPGGNAGFIYEFRKSDTGEHFFRTGGDAPFCCLHMCMPVFAMQQNEL